MAQVASKAYDLSEFRDPERELERLMRQAQVVQQAEHEALHALGFPTRGCVLDVGCGPGAFASGLARVHPELRPVGLDLERRALARGAETMPVVVGDGRALPFAADVFGAVYARLVLRYVDRPERMVEQMLRVARPGAVVVIEDADHGALELAPEIPGLAQVLSARHASLERRGADPQVVLRAEQLLRQAGAESVERRELHVTSEWIGAEAFAALVLGPIGEGVDADLIAQGALDALGRAIAAWAREPGARASTRVLFVAGRA